VAAAAGGADYIVYGPVFAPLSKGSDLAPRGLEGLGEAVRSVKIPVLALGGIASGTIEACMRTGAAGIAGISLFQPT
jgi:thiamine-phosphate pyrophosphorylase